MVEKSHAALDAAAEFDRERGGVVNRCNGGFLAALVTFMIVLVAWRSVVRAFSAALWELEDRPVRSVRWAKWAEAIDARWPWPEDAGEWPKPVRDRLWR